MSSQVGLVKYNKILKHDLEDSNKVWWSMVKFKLLNLEYSKAAPQKLVYQYIAEKWIKQLKQHNRAALLMYSIANMWSIRF